MPSIEAHYDQVSDAWHLIMGDNLHYGLFKQNDDSLELATQHLMDAMFELVELQPKLTVLDVGCGVGGPAFYLNQLCKARITGIALSQQEINIANRLASEKKLDQDMTFLVADGQNNQLDDSSFDLVIMMESSLLIPDKEKLFSENFRVLKPGGEIVICDQIKVNALKPAEMYRMGPQLEALQNTFGQTKTETLDEYQTLYEKAGFTGIETRDVTKEVSQTPVRWKQSCLEQKEAILKHITAERFQNFLDACDALSLMLEKSVLGYGIIKGRKAS